MTNKHSLNLLAWFAILLISCCLLQVKVIAQSNTHLDDAPRGTAKPVTIPLTIRIKAAQQEPEPELRMVDLTVSEDGEPQSVLSIRAMGTNAPITMAILIQDDLVSSVSNEIKSISDFVRSLPKGSRIMVGYIRAGSLQVRQKFTLDADKASRSLRVPLGTPTAAPFNPYIEVIEALRRFDSQPSGRRAILLVSDGLDTSRGIDSSAASQSVDLQRAISESQRRGIAIYSFYAPTALAAANLGLAANAQSSLQRLSDETGGQAFFQGTGAPVSFAPYLKNLESALDQQVALTYLSTHPGKGFHRIQVKSSTPGVGVSYPAGYSRN